MRIVAIKLIELTQFASQNQSIYLILYGVVVRCDVHIFRLTAGPHFIYKEVYVTPHQSKDPSPTIPSYGKKKEKGKTVEDRKVS